MKCTVTYDQGEQETTDQLDQCIKILVEKCGYPTNEEKERCQLELLFHVTETLRSQKVGKIANSSKRKCNFQQAIMVGGMQSNMKATIKDFH